MDVSSLSNAWAVVAGRVAPRQAPHFSLLRQRKVSKRKASRRPGRFAVPCAARFARGARKLASLKHARPFFRAPLRCSARPDGTGGSGYGLPRSQPCWPDGESVPDFRRHALASSAGPGGSGLRMSEGRAADKFAQTPPGPSNAVCPQRSGGTAHSARLSFGYFSLAKQRKVARPPGRDPARHRRQTSPTETTRQRPR